MYKILIVDDEDLIRTGLISRIDHHGFEFDVVMEASNGREALELIEKYRPNIVITDVRMPDVDGIELIKNAMEFYPEIKFIIISGYAEFEYAEQALNMGVSGYILKPIGDLELVQALNRVIKDLNNQIIMRNINSKKEVLEKYYESSTLEQKLNEIIHNTKTENGNENELELYSLIEINSNTNYILALINIDGKAYYQSGFKYNEIELAKFAMENIINEINSECKKIIINNYKDTNQIIVILMNCDPRILLFEADKFLAKVLISIEKHLLFSVTVGTSKITNKLSHELYKQANEALQQRFVYGNGQVFIFDNMESTMNFVIPKNELALLEKYIERCDVGNIEIMLKSIFSDRNLKGLPGVYVRVIWIEIMNILIRIGTELRRELLDNFDSNLFDVEVIYKFDTLDEIISYLYTLIINLLQLEKVVDLNSKNKIKIILKYIEQHYHEDINVNDLAYSFAMSPNYFSTIFKKSTGKTVIHYITEIRVSNACKLLSDTKASVVDISSKVGYQDTQYFFRVFKKNTGRTPLEYRKNNNF